MKKFNWLLLSLPFIPIAHANSELQTAIFAGGCFWCMQPPYDKTPGVKQTIVGYIGGTEPNPTYKFVSSGKSKYVEAVKVVYDPTKVSYEKLLRIFWYNVDPTRNNGQFCDFGQQYRPVIFYLDNKQKQLAEASKQNVGQLLNQPIRVAIIKAMRFYPAEEYHQNYYKKNPIRYKFYRFNCGRDRRLNAIWHGKKLK